MSTTDVAQEARKNGDALVQEVALDRIAESKTNPRKRFDPEKLKELSGNVRQYGELQPILVRAASRREGGPLRVSCRCAALPGFEDSGPRVNPSLSRHPHGRRSYRTAMH